MGAKAKRAPVCSENLIAIKLKGLAAPGEALKNKTLLGDRGLLSLLPSASVPGPLATTVCLQFVQERE